MELLILGVGVSRFRLPLELSSSYWVALFSLNKRILPYLAVSCFVLFGSHLSEVGTFQKRKSKRGGSVEKGRWGMGMEEVKGMETSLNG